MSTISNLEEREGENLIKFSSLHSISKDILLIVSLSNHLMLRLGTHHPSQHPIAPSSLILQAETRNQAPWLLHFSLSIKLDISSYSPHQLEYCWAFQIIFYFLCLRCCVWSNYLSYCLLQEKDCYPRVFCFAGAKME